MKVNPILYPSVLMTLLVLTIAACNEQKFEKCAEQASCALPPIADNAPEPVKKLRDNAAGKWKLYSMDIDNTFHKTKSNPTNLRFSMCVAHQGGIIFYRNSQEPVCQYCYEIKNAGDTLNLSIDEAGLSEFCKQQLQTSTITITGNEMNLIRQDSFIVKKIIYKKTDDNWNFIVN